MDSRPLQVAVPYLMPLLMVPLRKIPDQVRAVHPMMKPSTPLKTELMRALFVNTRDYLTAVDNLRDIIAWQAGKAQYYKRDDFYELYTNFRKVTVLVGERDDILDVESMKASAAEGQSRNGGVRIVQTCGTNHFITLERPEVVAKELDTLQNQSDED